MKHYCYVFVIALLSLSACSEDSTPEPANIALINGGIYTVDADRGWVEAIAIRDGVILATGSNDSIAAFMSSTTEVIDLAGAFAMPGLIDIHTHQRARRIRDGSF